LPLRPQHRNIRNLSTAEVNNILEQKQNVTLIDTRTAQEYSEGHLPTAINIPPQQFRAIHNHLPQDKILPLVFYCRGYN
jgi:phage shock protein E